MKSTFLIVIFSCFLASCSLYTNTTFKNWTSNQSFKGNGGSVTQIGNFEYWEHGAPEKEFKIIGIIEQNSRDSTGARILLGDYNKNEIIKHIEGSNGDGVIELDEDRYLSGINATPNYSNNTGFDINSNFRTVKQLAVFKYLK